MKMREVAIGRKMVQKSRHGRFIGGATSLAGTRRLAELAVNA